MTGLQRLPILVGETEDGYIRMSFGSLDIDGDEVDDDNDDGEENGRCSRFTELCFLPL